METTTTNITQLSQKGKQITEEKFPLATVRDAQRLFQAMQQLSAWIDLSGTTKTDLVYGDA